jgi:hypothetical protein
MQNRYRHPHSAANTKHTKETHKNRTAESARKDRENTQLSRGAKHTCLVISYKRVDHNSLTSIRNPRKSKLRKMCYHERPAFSAIRLAGRDCVNIKSIAENLRARQESLRISVLPTSHATTARFLLVQQFPYLRTLGSDFNSESPTRLRFGPANAVKAKTAEEVPEELCKKIYQPQNKQGSTRRQ